MLIFRRLLRNPRLGVTALACLAPRLTSATSISHFFRSHKASVAPMLALLAVALFGASGVVIDFSRAASARTAMQAALDAAAISLAKRASNVDAAQLTDNGSQYFNAVFQNHDVANIQTTATASSTSGGYSVSMSATGSVQSRFVGILGISTINVAVHSTAVSYADGLGCVLALNRHLTGAATGQGSTSVALNGCSIYDNSDDATALVAGGTAHISALSVGVVGNLSGASNISTTQGILTGIGAVPDPYADVSFPAFSGCTQANFSAHDTTTISPGVYCGGMKLNSGATVTLNPGIYYLDGGSLSVNGGATLIGSGVTLVFTSQNRNGFATATINGNATINLTPPTTGATSGIVMFGDRRMPIDTTFKFNGGAGQYLGGAVYIPNGSVDFAGGAGTSTNCTQLIADTINFTGNSALALNCKGYGTRPFSPLVVRLVS